MPTDQIIGPFGALVLALAVIAGLGRVAMVLWREHLAADLDDRRQRDLALEGWKAQTDANSLAAAAAEKDAAARLAAANRHRSDDPPTP